MGLFSSALQSWGSRYSLILTQSLSHSVTHSLTNVLSFPALGEITSEIAPLGPGLSFSGRDDVGGVKWFLLPSSVHLQQIFFL